MTPINLYDCKPNCDMEKAVLKGRATWCCAKCGRDVSLQYLLWYQAAHPEEWGNAGGKPPQVGLD